MDKRKASSRVHERGVKTVDEKRNKIPSSLVRLEGKGASLALTLSTKLWRPSNNTETHSVLRSEVHS